MNQQIVDSARCTHPDCGDSDVLVTAHKNDPVIECGGCDRILYRTTMLCPNCNSSDWTHAGRDDDSLGLQYECESCGHVVNLSSQV